MKTKIEYEEIECDFWNLSSIKEHFGNGDLYYKDRGSFFKFEKRTDVAAAAAAEEAIYKRVETQITLEREIADLDICARYEDDFILLHDECTEFWVSAKHILELAEVLKRHGK